MCILLYSCCVNDSASIGQNIGIAPAVNHFIYVFYFIIHGNLNNAKHIIIKIVLYLTKNIVKLLIIVNQNRHKHVAQSIKILYKICNIYTISFYILQESSRIDTFHIWFSMGAAEKRDIQTQTDRGRSNY